MLRERFYYLIHLEFLGFRYHGWQKQTDVKTVQYMLDRTLTFILEHDNFKTLGSSRTDAMVSAQHHMAELYIYEEQDIDKLKLDLNKNLPADIRVKSVEQVDKSFQIIGSEKKKEYHYYFSFGEKAHPYSSPFLANFQDVLDINLMKECAKMFEGTHNFKLYCYRAQGKKEFEREVLTSEIIPNTYLQANFFPKISFVYRIEGTGFLHHQVRLMMGTLIKVGLGELSLTDIRESLNGEGDYPIGFIAPSSGLHLYKNEINL
jgi:tRNA pseudouridine38-40 synthase